jgi:hypothetical protein
MLFVAEQDSCRSRSTGAGDWSRAEKPVDIVETVLVRSIAQA